MRMKEFLDAFIKCKKATHAEQDEGYNERPEVSLATKTKLKLGVGRAFRTFAAYK